MQWMIESQLRIRLHLSPVLYILLRIIFVPSRGTESVDVLMFRSRNNFFNGSSNSNCIRSSRADIHIAVLGPVIACRCPISQVGVVVTMDVSAWSNFGGLGCLRFGMLFDVRCGGISWRITSDWLFALFLVYPNIIESHRRRHVICKIFQVNPRETVRHSEIGNDA